MSYARAGGALLFAVALAAGCSPPTALPSGRPAVLSRGVGTAKRHVPQAAGVARRFLTLYALVCARPAHPQERAAIRAVAANDVAELMLEQPPEVARRAGRVVALTLKPGVASEVAARGRIRFRSGAVDVALTLARYRDAGWRVVSFTPAVPRAGTERAGSF